MSLLYKWLRPWAESNQECCSLDTSLPTMFHFPFLLGIFGNLASVLPYTIWCCLLKLPSFTMHYVIGLGTLEIIDGTSIWRRCSLTTLTLATVFSIKALSLQATDDILLICILRSYTARGGEISQQRLIEITTSLVLKHVHFWSSVILPCPGFPPSSLAVHLWSPLLTLLSMSKYWECFRRELGLSLLFSYIFLLYS